MYQIIKVEAATSYIIDLLGNDKEDSTRLAITGFLANTHPYNARSLAPNSVDWWTACRRFGFNSDLCDIADELSSSVCNSAGLELVFSTMRAVYGELRTNLGVAKAGKLSFLDRVLNR